MDEKLISISDEISTNDVYVMKHLMYYVSKIHWFKYPTNLATILLTIIYKDGTEKNIELYKNVPYPIYHASISLGINMHMTYEKFGAEIILHILKKNNEKIILEKKKLSYSYDDDIISFNSNEDKIHISASLSKMFSIHKERKWRTAK